MARARRKFSDEFKQEAVRLVTGRGVSMSQAARDLGIHVNLLRTWVRTATADAASLASGGQSLKQEQAELVRLRKEVATLRMERDILKKAAAYFAMESM
jgi:transposase